MPSNLKLLAPALLAALAAVSLLALPAHSQANDPARPAARPALSVSVVSPERAEWPLQLAANGSIAAWQEAIVGAETGGLRLTSVAADVGEQVHKGQLLASLQSDTTAAEIAQTRAGLAEAEASAAEARANAERARQIEKSGALSAQQIAQYLTAEQTALARVEALKARLQADEIRLAQTRILAPDDGTISARTATLGAVVQPGQELFRLIRQNRLEWRAELPEADLARIRKGMSARITTAGKGTVQGRVRMVAPTIDAQTRAGLVYVDLLGTADARPGMFARGEIALGQQGVLTLPQSAVMLRDGFGYVFRVGADKRLTQTKVSLGQRVGTRIAITGGLEAGAEVVASGIGFLSDGDTVRIVPPTPAAAR